MPDIKPYTENQLHLHTPTSANRVSQIAQDLSQPGGVYLILSPLQTSRLWDCTPLDAPSGGSKWDLAKLGSVDFSIRGDFLHGRFSLNPGRICPLTIKMHCSVQHIQWQPQSSAGEKVTDIILSRGCGGHEERRGSALGQCNWWRVPEDE